jgi:NAD(P)H-flavin reductase
VEKNMISQNKNLSKFFTKEDKFNIHKIVGSYCLIHYLFRFALAIKNIVLFGSTGSGGFSGNLLSIMSLIPHCILSFTSLFFHIPSKQSNKPMIWKEFRGHSISFAMRSIICFFIIWMRLNGFHISLLVQGFIVLITFIIADSITKKFQNNDNESTTRTMAYWDQCPKIVEKSFKFYYSWAQFMATCLCLDDDIFSPFAVMMPIQIAAFLMTCVKKNLFGPKIYHLLYITSLILPHSIYFFINTTNSYLFIGFITFSILIFRIYCDINKYIIWIPTIYFLCTKEIQTSIIIALICSIISTCAKMNAIQKEPKKFLIHRNIKKISKLQNIEKIGKSSFKLQFSFDGEEIGIELGQKILLWDKNNSEKNASCQCYPFDCSDGKFSIVVEDVNFLCNFVGEYVNISGPIGEMWYSGNIDDFKNINIIIFGSLSYYSILEIFNLITKKHSNKSITIFFLYDKNDDFCPIHEDNKYALHTQFYEDENCRGDFESVIIREINKLKDQNIEKKDDKSLNIISGNISNCAKIKLLLNDKFDYENKHILSILT